MYNTKNEKKLLIEELAYFRRIRYLFFKAMIIILRIAFVNNPIQINTKAAVGQHFLRRVHHTHLQQPIGRAHTRGTYNEASQTLQVGQTAK